MGIAAANQGFSRLRALAGGGGWIYRDAHYLVADVELDARAAAPWVPRPLVLSRPARAQIFTAWFPHTSFGSVYKEAGIFFDVDHWQKRAVHSPWMLVDDDVALIVGRELLGYPKKLGELSWEHDGDRIAAVACRRGSELVRMEGVLGERLSPTPMLGRPHRNVRSTTGLALPKVIAFTPKERVVEVRQATLDVSIQGSERDPLHELGLGRVLDARLYRVDLGAGLLPVPIAAVSPLTYARHVLFRSR